jgi:hypothetical protein
MKLRFSTGLALACLFSAVVPGLAQSTEAQERAAAAPSLVFGRPAAARGATATTGTLAELVAAHRAQLTTDAGARRAVVIQAARDTLGRAPTEGEVAKWIAASAVTYAEVTRHIANELAARPGEYRQVVDRAYRLVINRPVYEEEIAYWKPHGTLPFILLVGAIENWAQRNQPGLMVTQGTPSIAINSRFLRTLRLSLPVANEARALLGLPIWTDVARLSNPGYNVVAVGASGIASVGGVHFMLTGGGPLAGTD